MRSKPYLGIKDDVAHVVRTLLTGADDYHVVHTTRLARTVDVLVDHVQTGSLLEIGTSGFIPLACERLLPRVKITATKQARTSPEDAYEPETGDITYRVGERTVNVTCHVLDLEYDEIPDDDETYDAVLCCEVLEHMEIDPMFMLAELNRVLKPGGKLIVTTPNITSSRALHKILHGHVPYFYMQYHRSREYNRHNYEYSPTMLEHVLRCAGFEPTVWTEDLFEDPYPVTVKALHSAGINVRNTGDNLIAVAVKTSDVVDRFPDALYA